MDKLISVLFFVDNIGTTYLQAYLYDLHGNWRKNKLFPCSYAFVGEKLLGNKTDFSFPLYNLDNSSTFLNDNPTVASTPMVLDWRIGTQNCAQARTNSTAFACQLNTFCVDSDTNLGGYLCQCNPGYQGNPYLALGCQGLPLVLRL